MHGWLGVLTSPSYNYETMNIITNMLTLRRLVMKTLLGIKKKRKRTSYEDAYI